MATINILILSNLYPPNVIGGYERLCFDVSTALAEHGHRVTVLTSDFGGKVTEFPGQVVRRELRLLVGANIYDPFAGDDTARDAVNEANLAVLRRTLDEVRPDIVFAWNLFFLGASLLEALMKGGTRTVVMLTDNWLLVMHDPVFVSEFFRRHVFGAEPFVPPVRSRPHGIVARLLGRRRARAGMSAIFGSEFVRDLYAAGGLSFPSHLVIHNGVQQAGYGGAPFRDRRALVELGTLRLLFAGRLVDLKGADTAIKAMPLLDPAALGVSRVVLTLVGDTQDVAYAERLAETVAASDRMSDIIMQEPVAADALFDLFQKHDIYLFPSLYEPFSLTLIHALACGIPTVASRTGGNVEIVSDGESGLLSAKGDAADLAHAITRLASDPAMRARLAVGGRVAAAQFTFEKMVGAMEHFLR